MRIRITKLFLFLFISGVASFAQSPETDLNCPQKQVFVKAETAPVYKHGMEKMKAFFSDAALDLVPPNANGTIELDVVICFQDEAVLRLLNNKTNMYIDTMPWKRHFEDMKGWKAGKQNGRFISYSVKLTLVIKDGMVTKVKYSNGATTIESVRRTPRGRKGISSLYASV